MAGKGAKKRARREKKKEDKGWQKRGKRKVCIFCVDRIAHVDYKDASTLRKFISGSPIKVRAKAGEGGRLFGSVTAADLADELERQTGETIDRRMIHLEEPIRSVGVHEVRIHLHPEVNAPISVEIEPA